MMNWRAKSSLGGVIGIVLTVLMLTAFGVVLWLTLSAALESYDDDPSPGANLGTFGLGLAAFGLALLVALLAYRTWRFFQVSYYLDRNAIKIELGGKKQIIPLANIRQVIPAESLLEVLRQEAYGEKPPPKAGQRDDGVKIATYSQPRTQNTRTAERVETTSAADSSVEEIVGSDIVEGEIIEADVVEGTPAADSGNNPTDSDSPATSEHKEAQTTQKSAEKKKSPVPKHVAFKVKTRLLTSWPGFYTNQGWLASLGEIQFYSSQPFAKTLLVRTTNRTYAISPSDAKQFVTEYRLRRNLGAIEAVEEEVIRGKFLSHPLWQDWLGRGLILTGVLANLALFAFLLGRFAELPPILRLHYNKFGVVDRLESAGGIFLLPTIGLFTAVVNSVIGAILHPRERVPALLLYGSIIAVQLLLWIAAIGIIVTSGS